MLRQALDEADHQQRTERSRLMSPPPIEVVTTTTQTYTTSTTSTSNSRNRRLDNDYFDHHHHHGEEEEEENHESEEDEDDDDDDDDEYLLGDWHSEGGGGSMGSSSTRDRSGCLQRLWKTAKGCFLLVINVENLWDSPTTTSQGREISRRNHCVVLFWFFILAISYAAERTTYKLIVDRTGPFRLFSVEMVTLIHSLLVGSGMMISAVYRKDFTMQDLGIPMVDVGLMALLDTVHMLLVFLTGYHVAPTLTVILSQFTLPLTALMSQFVHPDGYFKRCCGQSRRSDANDEEEDDQMDDPETFYNVNVGTPQPGCGGLAVEHISGSVIISLAVLLAISPSIYSLIDRTFFIYADPLPLMTAYNTMLFVSSCIPAAASQLYKEHIFLQNKQPVQPDYLNLVLSIFQLIFTSIMSPLVYTLLGFAAADDWPTLYPSSEFSKNFGDGFRCFFYSLDEDTQESGYYDDANCQHSLLLVVLYAFSLIAIGVAVDKICNAGATKVMYRGVSAGIILVSAAALSLIFCTLTLVASHKVALSFVGGNQSVPLRHAYSLFQLWSCN
jgi:hypothetical protein